MPCRNPMDLESRGRPACPGIGHRIFFVVCENGIRQPHCTRNVVTCFQGWSVITTSRSVLTANFQVNLGWPMHIEAKDDGGGGDNWTTGAINRAKLQSNHHHQQTNIQFLQAGCSSRRPTNSVKALKGKYHIPWTCLTQAHLGVFRLCFWPLIAPGYLGGGLPCLSPALWCQYPSTA